MKIALLGDTAVKSQGGAFQNMKTLGEFLSHENQVKYLESTRIAENQFEIQDQKNISEKAPFPHEICYLTRQVEHWFRYQKQVKKYDPDLIISQQSSMLLGTLVARDLDIPHIPYLINEDFVTFDYYSHESLATNLLNYLFKPINTSIFRKIIRDAEIVLSCSKYIRDKYKEAHNFESEVINSFIEKEKYQVEEPGDKILHINPQTQKGIDTTLEVARQTDEQFIISNPGERVDRINEIRELDNVELLGLVEDMREAYSRAKMVLMPSKWQEPFGRVPIEAAINGIPTICSGNGGLRESTCNPKLKVEKNKPENYIEKIKEVEENYDKYSERAKKNSEKKIAAYQFRKFTDIVTKKLDLEIDS